MNDCKLSVVLPNYNYAHYFEHRLLSVLNQKFPIFEIIILDDASKDNSIKVINETLKKYQTRLNGITVKTFFNRENSGNVFKQWQKGITESSGDFIWICELDDDNKPGFLRAVMPAFQNQNVVLSFSNSVMKNDDIKGAVKDNVRQLILNPIREDRPTFSYTRSGEVEITKVLYIYNTIPNVSAAVFRKKSTINFAAILKEASSFHLSGDWYFYIQLLLNGDVHYCSRALNIHRIHSSSVTGKTPDKIRLAEMRKIHKIIENELDIPPETIEKAKRIEQKF